MPYTELQKFVSGGEALFSYGQCNKADISKQVLWNIPQALLQDHLGGEALEQIA